MGTRGPAASPVALGSSALDLSFPFPFRDAAIQPAAVDLTVILAGVAVRQVASATAQAQAALDTAPMPPKASFNTGVARVLSPRQPG